MAALQIFILWVSMETLLSFLKHSSSCGLVQGSTSLSLHLPTFLPFELIFSFLFVPLSPSSHPHPLCFKILSPPGSLLTAVRLGCLTLLSPSAFFHDG